jgi:hypothetical protein
MIAISRRWLKGKKQVIPEERDFNAALRLIWFVGQQRSSSCPLLETDLKSTGFYVPVRLPREQLRCNKGVCDESHRQWSSLGEHVAQLPSEITVVASTS